MRVAVVVALVLLSACASDELALAPPPGVDLSGHWRLNEADSDDPLRLIQSQMADPSKPAAAGGQGGGQGGRGRGRGGGGGSLGGGIPAGPSIPAVGALGEGLRWPGKEVEIKQVAGVVAITSAGVNQVYQPTSGDPKPSHHRKPGGDADRSRRDLPTRDRGDGPPAACGWADKTLVVQSGELDDDHPPFEERYSLSDDGQRLIEVVGFKGGRSGGFTMSRVWDRVGPGATTPTAAPDAPPAGSVLHPGTQ